MLWIATAALAFLLLYFLVVRWYLPTVWDVPNWDWPPAYHTWWLHAAVWLIALVLFSVSVVAVCIVSGWLSFIPFVLLLVLISKQRFRRESQIDATIKKAIVLHYELKQRGVSEPDIYKQIAAQLTDLPEDRLRHYFDSSPGHEWTLEILIQYLILPSLELWQRSAGFHMADVEAAAMRDRIRGFQQSFESLRTAAEHDGR